MCVCVCTYVHHYHYLCLIYIFRSVPQISLGPLGPLAPSRSESPSCRGSWKSKAAVAKRGQRTGRWWGSTGKNHGKNHGSMDWLIGLRENLHRKPMGFYHQIGWAFRLKCSHHPILWMGKNPWNDQNVNIMLSTPHWYWEDPTEATPWALSPLAPGADSVSMPLFWSVLVKNTIPYEHSSMNCLKQISWYDLKNHL